MSYDEYIAGIVDMIVHDENPTYALGNVIRDIASQLEIALDNNQKG